MSSITFVFEDLPAEDPDKNFVLNIPRALAAYFKNVGTTLTVDSRYFQPKRQNAATGDGEEILSLPEFSFRAIASAARDHALGLEHDSCWLRKLAIFEFQFNYCAFPDDQLLNDYIRGVDYISAYRPDEQLRMIASYTCRRRAFWNRVELPGPTPERCKTYSPIGEVLESVACHFNATWHGCPLGAKGWKDKSPRPYSYAQRIGFVLMGI